MTIVRRTANHRVMKRLKRSCELAYRPVHFLNVRIETASSAGFAGAFVDHLVETKGVSELFFL